MENKIVQSLWIGDELSNMELLCLNSYLKNGHDFHLYTYGEIKNLPKNVIVKDASEIIPRNRLIRDGHGSYAGFSDVFRFTMLYLKGGWWVDMDGICLKYFDIDSEYCFSSEYAMDRGTSVNCGFMKSSPKAEFLEDILNYMELSGAAVGNTKGIWGDFGPKLLSSALKRYDSKVHIKPPHVFCPINWNEMSSLVAQHKEAYHPETLAIHLWNEIWRKSYLDKNATYHPESIYEQLKTAYL